MLGIIPLNPTITVDKDAAGNPVRFCVDAKTERILQNQRIFAMTGSGVLLASAFFLKGPRFLRYTVGGMGVLCFLAHYTARKAVEEAEKKAVSGE